MDYLCRYCKALSDGKTECDCLRSKQDKFIEKYIKLMLSDENFNVLFQDKKNSYKYATNVFDPEINYAWTLSINF